MQTYNTVTPSIGKIKGKMLDSAMPREVLGITGEHHVINKNESDTVIFGRWLPHGATAGSPNNWDIDANAHRVQDGVTPAAETLDRQDIVVQLQEFACLYSYSNKVAELYEDNIPTAMKDQTGVRMGQLREIIRYGALQGCSNMFYANGVARSAVNTVSTLNGFRAITRSLEDNRCDTLTEVISSSRNYDTSPVEAGFLVFGHSDCEQDWRDLPGFNSVVNYGGKPTIHPRELGGVEKYRFVTSPELKPILGGGGASAPGAGIKQTGGQADVYPVIVVGKGAWGDVALRGKDSFDVIHLPANRPDSNDPLGQKGFIGARFYAATFIQNDYWMAVYEVAVKEL